jgi:hypothetical protein
MELVTRKHVARDCQAAGQSPLSPVLGNRQFPILGKVYNVNFTFYPFFSVMISPLFDVYFGE